MKKHSKMWLFAVVALAVGVPALAADVTGTWTWSVERNGNTIETTLKLKQDGEKVTGTISGRNNTETEISDGKLAGDMLTFKVTREFNGNTFVQEYHGKVSGDSIKGERKSERNGEVQTREWEAKRAK